MFPGYHNSLHPYEKLVTEKFLTKSENGDLVLYKYTDQVTYDKYWNEYTRAARGIIFNKVTGECEARPFPKFFSIGEIEESFVQNLPDVPYSVYDKMDGSLGIMYWQDGLPKITTCGSFYSDQAVVGTKIIQERYVENPEEWQNLNRDYTLLFEIIYPENKIVVDYKGVKDLFLLAIINKATGEEVSWKDLLKLADILGFPVADEQYYTIGEMIQLQKTLDYNVEGFVVRFDNGLRIKIKGADYLRIHRAISTCTPLNCWSEMKQGKLPQAYKDMLPIEVLPKMEEMESQLHDSYIKMFAEIVQDTIINFPQYELGIELTKEIKKEIGLLINSSPKLFKHPHAMFIIYDGKIDLIDKYIKNRIRPTGNHL